MKSQSNRGIVLVAVLLSVAIMSVMVVAVTSLTRASIASQKLEAKRLATELALAAGIETAKARILATLAEQRVFFDGTPEILNLDGGVQLEVRIRDAAGLIDLNRSDMKLLEAALAGGLASSSAELLGRIGEWRQKAEARASGERAVEPAKGGTAPAEGGEAQPAAQRPIIFLSVDQLLAMIPADEARELPEHFTVFNPRGLVNPAAAPTEVMLAVPGITPGDLARIDGARRNRAWKSDVGLLQLLDRMAPFLAMDDASVFIIGVRLVRGSGVIVRSEADAVVLLTETAPSPFRTLAANGL